MASSLQLRLCSFIFLVEVSVAQRPFLTGPVLMPVTKDLSTQQYVTQIHLGTPHVPFSLAVDLGAPFLWLDCGSNSKQVSSSFRSVRWGSLQCSLAKLNAFANPNCLPNTTDPTPAPADNTCGVHLYNPVSDTETPTLGEAAEDTVAVGSELGQLTTLHDFVFSRAPAALLQGLASGVKGVLGLGRSRISLPSQLANALGFHRKFTLCLSSSTGAILAGDRRLDVSKSLTYTPLVTSPPGSTQQGYFIDVKSIRINGKRLSLDGQRTQISTLVPYTILESQIYDTFTKAYVKLATAMNLSRVASVAPFGVCFSSEGIQETRVGPAVPAIDLVLQSEVVKWRIHGRNSMVKVSEKVMCLGLLDGGVRAAGAGASIVIGGYQLEDHALEFDFGASRLGVSPSLLMSQTTCSDQRRYVFRR